MEAEEPTDAHKNQRETNLLRSLKPLPPREQVRHDQKHTEHPQPEPKKNPRETKNGHPRTLTGLQLHRRIERLSC